VVFSFFLMVVSTTIMAHYDAGDKREETITSSYGTSHSIALFKDVEPASSVVAGKPLYLSYGIDS
jgi:hypothetical protein